MFSLAKPHMEKTKLWQIVSKMPKGALLHAHMDAMVDYEYLFEVLFTTPGMHIYSSKPILTPADLEVAPVKFRFVKTDHGMFHRLHIGGDVLIKIVNEKSIWSKEYVPQTPILLTAAAEAFPNGGKAGFLAWLSDRCTITNKESIEHHHGVDAVWRKFSSVFTILGTFIMYEPIFKKVSCLLKCLHGEGLELTVIVLAKNVPTATCRWCPVGGPETCLCLSLL